MSAFTNTLGVIAAAGAAGGPTFGLTGGAATGQNNVSTEDDGLNCDGNLYVDADGGLRRRYENFGSFVTTQFGTYSNGDESDSAFGDDYHVKVTYDSVGSSSNTYLSGAGLGTWLPLTSARSWLFRYNTSGPNLQISNFTVAFSDDGGSTTLDSFTFSMRHDHPGP
jgi:hypothetical protein